MLLDYDFEAVFPQVWAHLYSWYSADVQIARYYKIDESEQHDLTASMSVSTLRQALMQGKVTFSEGKSQLKNLVLDLYPSHSATFMIKHSERVDT